MIRAHWIRLAIFAIAGGLLALGISLIAPKKYEGFVQILIDQKPINMNSTADITGEAVELMKQFTRPRSIQTQVQQLTSFDVISRAGQSAFEELGRPTEDMDQFQAANLSQNISVDAEMGSDNITLRVRMTDPNYAKTVAKHMYLALEDQNRAMSRSMGERIIQVLSADAKNSAAELKRIDSELRAAREKYNAPNIEGEVQSQVTSLAEIKQSRDLTAMELSGAQSRLAKLEEEIKRVPQQIKSGTTEINNETLTQFEAQLAQARTERAALSERYHDDHESMIQLNSRIKQLEKEITALKSRKQGPTSYAPNPNWQSLNNEISQARAQVDGLAARLATANADVSRMEADLKQLPQAQEQINELMRKQLVQERINAAYTAQLQTIKNSETSQSAPTSLITPANVYPEPVSPKIPINVVIGVLFGLILGVLSMLGTEAKKQPVRSLAQLNNLSLHPVYRMVPELRSPFRGLEKAPPEAFETLLVNCLSSDKRPYRVALVGVTKDAGASTAAINYAIAAERHGLSTSIISADPKSTVKRYIWKSGTVPQGKVVRVTDSVDWIPFTDGSVMTGKSGHMDLSPDITGYERDVTLFDFEPTTQSAEYAFAAAQMDEVILFVRANDTRTVDFLSAQQALRDAGAKVVTVVFSRTSDLTVVTDVVEPEFDDEPKSLAS